MKNVYLSGLAIGTLLLFGSSVAYSQSATLHLDDSGKIVAAEQHHHAKVGHKITWVRQSASNRPWFVKFDRSPCAEGSVFGSDRTKTCTVKVTCTVANSSGCGSYKYSSATGPNAPLNDPDIIVDP